MTLIHLFVLPDADTDLVLLIHKLKTTLFPFLVRIAVAGVSAAPHLVVSLASAGDVAALLQTVASLGAKASEARPAQLERAASSDTLNAPLVASGGAPSHTLLLSAPKAFTKEMVQRILQFYPGVDFERSDHRVVVFNDALCASMAMDDLLSTTNFKVAFEPTSAEGQDDEALDVDDSLTTILIRNIPRSSEFEVLASQREKPVWGRCGVSAAMHSLLSKYPGFSRIHYGSKNIQAEFIDATAAYKAFGRLSASCSKMSFTLEVKPQFVSAESNAIPTQFVSLRLSPPGIDPLDARGILTRIVPSSSLKNIIFSSKKTSCIAEFANREASIDATTGIRNSTNLFMEYSETSNGATRLANPEITEKVQVGVIEVKEKPVGKKMEPKKKKIVSLALNSETLPAENPNDTKANHLSTAKENVKWVPTPPKLELKSSAYIERSPTPTFRAESSSRSPSPISANDTIVTSRGFTGFTFTNVPLGFNIRELVIREPGFIKLLYKPSLRTSNDSSVDIYFSSESSAKSAKTLLGRLFVSSILPEQTLLRSDTLENATSQTKSSPAASTVLKFKNSESKNSPVLLIESRIHQLLSCFDGFIGLFYGSMTVYINFASIGQATAAYTALLSTTNLNIRYSNEVEMENAIKLAEQNAGKMQRSKVLTAVVENGTTTVIGEAPSTKKVDLTQPIATTSNGAVASLTTAPESSNAVKRVKTFDSSGRAISPSPSETVSMDNQKHKSKKKPTAATPSPEPTSASTTTQPATVTDVLKIFRVGDGNKKLLIPVGQATEAGKMCNGFISAVETGKTCFVLYDTPQNAFVAMGRLTSILKFSVEFSTENEMLNAKKVLEKSKADKQVRKAMSYPGSTQSLQQQEPPLEQVDDSIMDSVRTTGQFFLREGHAHGSRDQGSGRNFPSSNRQSTSYNPTGYHTQNQRPISSHAKEWTPLPDEPSYLARKPQHRPLNKRGGVLEGGPDDDDLVDARSRTSLQREPSRGIRGGSRGYYESRNNSAPLASGGMGAPPPPLSDREWGSTLNAPSNEDLKSQGSQQHTQRELNVVPSVDLPVDEWGGDGSANIIYHEGGGQQQQQTQSYQYQNETRKYQNGRNSYSSGSGFYQNRSNRGGHQQQNNSWAPTNTYRGGYGTSQSSNRGNSRGYQSGTSGASPMKVPENETGGYSRN